MTDFNLELQAKLSTVRVLAQNLGLIIKLIDKDQPFTDGKTLFVPRPNPSWGSEHTSLWEYFVHHELGHCIKPMDDWKDYLKSKPHLSPQHGLIGCHMNLLDDYRQERYGYDKYRGRQHILYRGRVLFYNWQETLPKNFDVSTMSDEQKAGEVLHAFERLCRDDWQPGMAGYTNLVTKHFDSWCQDKLEKLNTLGYKDKLNNSLTSPSIHNLIRDMYTNVFEIDPDQAESEAEQTRQAAQEAREAGEKAWKEFLETIKDILKEVERSTPHHHMSGKEGEGYNIQKPKPSDNIEPDWAEFVLDPSKVEEFVAEPDYSGMVLPNVGSGLSTRVRKLFQSRALKRYEHGVKRGKLSAKKVYRSSLDDPRTAELIMKRQTETLTYNTAVTLLVDASGSMHGDKYAHAVKCAVLLKEVFDSVKLPLEILAFTESGRKIHNVIVKPFDERVSSDIITQRFAGIDQGANADGESILWAYSRLIKRDNPRRVLIVFSDGQPNSDVIDGISTYTKHVVSAIEKGKNCEIYGIGINNESVKDFYTDWSVINNPRHLESTLFKVIESKILR